MPMRKILLIILFCYMVMSFQEIKTIPKENNTEVQDTSFLQGELNDSILYLALEYYDVKHPRTVLAQAKLETGNYTSNHCVNKNNILGLYNSRKGEYFSFDHWTDCIQAYKDMIEYRLRDGEDYYSFLKRIKYASNPDYTKKLKEIEKDL